MKISDKFVARLCLARSAGVATRRRCLAVQFGRKREVSAGYVLNLLAKRAQFCRTVARVDSAVIALGRAIVVFVGGHSFRGGTELILLKLEVAHQSRTDGFLGAEFRRGWLLRLLRLLRRSRLL